MSTARKSAKAGGRPSLHGEMMKSRTVRMTDAQAAKLERLGGAAWVRAQIEAAEEPSK